METVRSFSEITPEMIQQWKANYGDIKQIVISRINRVPGNDGKVEEVRSVYAQFVVCKPSRTVMDLLGKYQTSQNVIEANKTIISNCVLGGDLDLLEKDGFLYTEVLDRLRNLADELEAEIKNI